MRRSFGRRAILFRGLPARPTREGRSFLCTGPKGISHLGTIDHLYLLHNVAERPITVLSLIWISSKITSLDLPCGIESRVDSG